MGTPGCPYLRGVYIFMTPEVTIAHTKIFLARGWEIDETGEAQIFIATCHCFSPYELSTEQRSTI